jgi:WD40 repeat protein
MLLALEAWRRSDTFEARSAALTAVQRTDGIRALMPNRSPSSIGEVAVGGGLLAAADDRAITLFDLRTHRRRGRPLVSRHAQQPAALAVSPRGDAVAAAYRGVGRTGGDGIVLWRLNVSLPQAQRLDRASGVDVAFNHDGTLVAGTDGFHVRAWDVETGTGRFDHAWRERSPGTYAEAVGFGPDGRTIGELTSAHFAEWALDGRGLERIERLPRGLQHPEALSVDLRHIVAADDTGRAWLWKVGSPRATRLPAGAPSLRESSSAAAFSPDGERLAIPSREGTIRIFDARRGRAIGRPLVGGSDAVSVAWNDGVLVSGGSSGLNTVWGLAASNALSSGFGDTASNVFWPHDPGPSLAFGRTGALAWNDGKRLFLLPPRGRLRRADLTPGMAGGLAFSPDGRTLASVDDGTIRTWDLELRPRTQLKTVDLLPVVAIGPRGLIASVDSLDRLRLWGPDSTEHRFGPAVPFWIFVPSAPTASPLIRPSLAFGPDGHSLAASSARDIRVYAVTDRGLRLRHVLRGQLSTVTTLAFAPDGAALAAGADDGAIWLWDLPAGTPIGEPLRTGTRIAGVAFSPDGRTLASTGGDGALRLWDVPSRRALGPPIPAYDGFANQVAFSPNGRTLATSGAPVRGPALLRWSPLLWADRPQQVATRLCAIAGRSLTHGEWRRYLPGFRYRSSCG